MFDRNFFTSKLGIAALVSAAMMVIFNVYALNIQHVAAAPAAATAAGSALGLPLVVLA
ncbi:hypothetical protein [Croceibacterium aestuarii]|uniref:hypothetical protein n=1 Tax=Croceibacterium aestuarii TaxID=3064139 RepID=UPI00272EC22B|nr:hypothetical protein [Croceibacterium sp. D39]